jgi:hypothetical protein
MTDFRSIAVSYAEKGWSVFPCDPRSKRPLTPHGHLDASREPAQLQAWWARWPRANIGAAIPDALLIIDIDPRNGGSLVALEALTGPLPETLTVLSGRGDGGHHLSFRRPPGGIVRTRLPRGIDLKTNGYTIVPPSLHPISGRPYTWACLAEPAPLPLRLRELLRPVETPSIPLRKPPGAGAALVHFVAQLSSGERNRGL